MMVLFARVILDLVLLFARGWRPRGIVLVVANPSVCVTDLPIRWFDASTLRPPRLLVRNGNDVGFMVLFSSYMLHNGLRTLLLY